MGTARGKGDPPMTLICFLHKAMQIWFLKARILNLAKIITFQLPKCNHNGRVLIPKCLLEKWRSLHVFRYSCPPRCPGDPWAHGPYKHLKKHISGNISARKTQPHLSALKERSLLPRSSWVSWFASVHEIVETNRFITNIVDWVQPCKKKALRKIQRYQESSFMTCLNCSLSCNNVCNSPAHTIMIHDDCTATLTSSLQLRVCLPLTMRDPNKSCFFSNVDLTAGTANILELSPKLVSKTVILFIGASSTTSFKSLRSLITCNLIRDGLPKVWQKWCNYFKAFFATAGFHFNMDFRVELCRVVIDMIKNIENVWTVYT